VEPGYSGGQFQYRYTLRKSFALLTIIKTFQVSLLYYVGTTKSHPPIPEHLSPEAKDFLLKCLHKYDYDHTFKLFIKDGYGCMILKKDAIECYFLTNTWCTQER
jgi:hypothetical protein